jgi:hypothetical protein
MLTCDICGYQAKTPQGLAGHRQFKHQLAARYEKARELALVTKDWDKCPKCDAPTPPTGNPIYCSKCGVDIVRTT